MKIFKKKHLKSLIPLSLYGLLMVIIAFLIQKYVNRDILQSIVQNSGNLGVFVYYLIEVAYITFTPFLNTFILIASGYIFGGHLGFIVNFLAETSSLFLIVFLVKRYGRPLLKKVVSESFYKNFDKITQKVGPILLLVAYVVPFSPDDELTYVVAAGPLGFKRFILPVILGSIGKASYSYIGDLGGPGIITATYFRISVLVIGLILVGLQEYVLKKKNKKWILEN
jgi:uncharacterized membrane protein YdjX (TVP38/TMEM64 family)